MSVESGLPADLFQHGHEQNLGENRRKATGSHYSDLDLALEVVRATLEPIFAAAWTRSNHHVELYTHDIRNLKILDPAMGAGHLLLVAWIEIAREIAYAELIGNPRPSTYFEYIASPNAWSGMPNRETMDARVVELLPSCVHCIYGVDIVPETVEVARGNFRALAQTNALNLRCGDSLFGATKCEAESMQDPFDTMFGQVSDTDPWDEAFYAAYGSRRLTNMFHWEREFPNVKFDAVIANPPFIGDRNLRGVLGEDGVRYLSHRYSDGAVVDLCGYFVLKLTEWLHEDRGVAGIIATNSIAQGKNRMKVLVPLVAGTSPKFEIYRSCRSRVWPGDASVHIATIHMRRAGRLELAVSPRRIVQVFPDDETQT